MHLFSHYWLCIEQPSLFHAVFKVCFAFLLAQEGKKKCTVHVFICDLLQPVMLMCFFVSSLFYLASCNLAHLTCLLVIILVGNYSRLPFFFFLHDPSPTCCDVLGPEVILYLNEIKEKTVDFESRAWNMFHSAYHCYVADCKSSLHQHQRLAVTRTILQMLPECTSHSYLFATWRAFWTHLSRFSVHPVLLSFILSHSIQGCDYRSI